MKFTIVMVSWLGAARGAAAQAYIGEPCPEPCSLLFNKLDRNILGERVQNTAMNQRGEPKSGTSFMFEWGQASFLHACHFLQGLYGNWSCQTRWEGGATFQLIFEPNHPRVKQARCRCQDVDRVTISLSMFLKHTLPVSASCPWQHVPGVDTRWDLLRVMHQKQADNFEQLREVILTSGLECALTQHEPQMVVLRDPRPMVVSAYYFTKIHDWNMSELQTVDEFVLSVFPSMCQWLAIRYVLFEEVMAAYSTVFWYDESLADPLLWHRRWHASLGLRFPDSVLEETTNAAVNRRFSFPTKGRDPHPGGAAAKPSRSFVEELRPETLSTFDDVMRQWLPPTYRVRFGVSYDQSPSDPGTIDGSWP